MNKLRLTAILLFAALLAVGLCGCSQREKNGIAFICSPAGVEERFEGQALRTAVYEYCTANSIPYYEYISDGSPDYYNNAVRLASENCLLAVCDFRASAALAPRGGEYDIPFLLVNHTGTVPSGSRAVTICEQDAAFMAGYAAARDGNSSFAFLGGEKTDMSSRYFDGFVQGIAAGADGRDVNVIWTYTGADEASDNAVAVAEDMFIDGCDIMFVCGGSIYKSAVRAANITKKFLIGGEMDQAGESERFVTAAVKNYDYVIGLELDSFLKEKMWRPSESGTRKNYRYADGGVELPEYTGAFRFNNFTHEQLEELKTALDSGTLGAVVDGTSFAIPENVHIMELPHSE